MPSKRYVALDSLRGVAAVLVALHHFTANGVIVNSLLVRNAWLFVDFFFVLSGFIIAANYREKLAGGYSIANFMQLRLGRVYPLHLAMLMLWVLAECGIAVFGADATTGGRPPFTGPAAAGALPAQLFLVQSIGLKLDETWNWVAWSISTEFWTYLVFALLVTFGPVELNRRLATLMLAMMVFVTLVPASSDLGARWLSLARCLYGFCAGVFVFNLSANFYAWQREWSRTWRNVPLTALLEAAAIALGVGFVVASAYSRVHLVAPLVFGVVVLIFAADAGPVSRVLATAVFARLGLLSYSIYMIHPFLQLRVLKPVGLAVQKLTGIPVFASMVRSDGATIQVWGTESWQGDIETVVMLLVVVAAAALTYRFIETPGRDYARRRVAAAAATVPGGAKAD